MAFLDKLIEIRNYLAKIEQLNKSVEKSGELNRLQTDLVKEYLRDLYELYAVLENEGMPNPIESPTPEVKVEAEVIEVQEPVAKQVELEAIEKDTPVTPDLAKPEAQSEPANEETDIAISVLEKFQKESTTTELNRKKVTGKSMTELIPLNAKFMFIIEFFDNSISRYESAIAALDNLQTKTEVLDYMQQNSWTPEIMESQQELIDRFIRIVDLKYAD